MHAQDVGPAVGQSSKSHTVLSASGDSILCSLTQSICNTLKRRTLRKRVRSLGSCSILDVGKEMGMICTLIVPTYCDSEMTSSVMAMDAKGREWKVGVAGEELGVETSEKVAPTGEWPAELGEDEVMLRQGRDLGEKEEEVGVSGSAARVFVSRGGMALGMRLR